MIKFHRYINDTVKYMNILKIMWMQICQLSWVSHIKQIDLPWQTDHVYPVNLIQCFCVSTPIHSNYITRSWLSDMEKDVIPTLCLMHRQIVFNQIKCLIFQIRICLSRKKLSPQNIGKKWSQQTMDQTIKNNFFWVNKYNAWSRADI